MAFSKQKITVLVVDDEDDLCWAFGTGVIGEDFDIVTVNTGEASLELIKENKYPIIILDSKLPGIDGIEVSKITKGISPDTKIILFSGYYDREDKEIQAGLKSGLFYDFLCKPFEFDDISRMIKKIIRENT